MTGNELTPPTPVEEHDEDGLDREKARRGARLLLEAMGEDPERDELIDTWQRRVPDTLATLSEGNRLEAKPEMRTFDAETDELVIKTWIPFYSLCEHHLLPFQGVAHVAYRPNGRVVGLSKLVRYVRWRSRRPTIQEGLTREITTGLAEEIDAEGVVVELSATHMCETMRGVETETETITRASTGDISDRERARFEDAIARATTHGGRR